MTNKIETKDQALKVIHGRLFAAGMIALLEIAVKQPREGESLEAHQDRVFADLKSRNMQQAEALFADLEQYFGPKQRTEPVPASNDTGEEKGLGDMAGGPHEPFKSVYPDPADRRNVAMGQYGGMKPAAFKTGAAVIQEEIDELILKASAFMEQQHRDNMKRLGDDIKRVVTGLKVNKVA